MSLMFVVGVPMSAMRRPQHVGAYVTSARGSASATSSIHTNHHAVGRDASVTDPVEDGAPISVPSKDRSVVCLDHSFIR